MHALIRQQLERHVRRLAEIDFLLTRPDIMADMPQFMRLSREHAEVAVVLTQIGRASCRERV